MNFSKVVAAAAVAVSFAAPAAMAMDDVLPTSDSVFVKWGSEGDWTIYVDEDKGSCLAERVDANKNVLQLGLTKSADFGYLGVFTMNDVDIKSGKETMVFSLDGKLYEGKASKKTKHLSEGYTGGYVLTNNPMFVEDVMKKYDMIVFPKKEYAFSVSLDGTFKAIEAARKCNMEQKG